MQIINPLTPLKPKKKQNFFDSMDRTLKCDHSLLLSSTLLWCCLLFNFTQFLNFGLGTVTGVKAINEFLKMPF